MLEHNRSDAPFLRKVTERKVSLKGCRKATCTLASAKVARVARACEGAALERLEGRTEDTTPLAHAAERKERKRAAARVKTHAGWRALGSTLACASRYTS